MHGGGYELREPQVGGVDKTHGAPGVCARTGPQPQYCTGAGVADYANTDGGGGGSTQSKVSGIALSKQKNTKPQTCKVRVLQRVSVLLPKKSSEKGCPPLPSTESAGKVPQSPEPYRDGCWSARASEGRPHPRPGKGGADSHIHQFGRLVHTHGEAILTLRCHQQLLHRGSHRLHPKRPNGEISR